MSHSSLNLEHKIFLLILTWYVIMEMRSQIKIVALDSTPEDEWRFVMLFVNHWSVCTHYGTDSLYNTSVGEGVRIWKIVAYYESICTEGSSWHAVWCICERNYWCISEDNSWFLTWTTAKEVLSITSNGTSDESYKQKREKIYVSWVMGHFLNMIIFSSQF